jgi:hypothetical protein
MGRNHVIRDLNDEQFTFVIEAIINGQTDREICASFEKNFQSPLAKSSLNRWRQSAGNELAERYRLARYTASQLLEDLEVEGTADKFQLVIGNIEDRLLTSMREVISRDPVKLLRIRLDEEKRRLKEREINLKERQLDLELARTTTSRIDVQKLPGTILELLLEFIATDANGLKWFKANAKNLETFITKKYATSDA